MIRLINESYRVCATALSESLKGDLIYALSYITLKTQGTLNHLQKILLVKSGSALEEISGGGKVNCVGIVV